MMDGFQWVPFSRKFVFAPATWKMFNTYEREQLEEKQWEVYV
jgi:hypothetical protein